ncbi:hypothetical protein [Vibrio hyugaensis]|uniref:hypothetical protein n=1 Tax=Vibrio hyugaensis TaxID=1534743 RepID=UPI0005F082FD|nr:hypothetical protein [Vibrio hyugaensis]
MQNVEKDSKSYHKSWARKFGNKYQSAKNWIKRDKKMVAMNIAQNLPQLEEAFDQIRRSYGNINSLKQLQDMMLERNLVESGLLGEKDLTYKLDN